MKNIHLIPTDKPSRLWVNNLRRRYELEKEPFVGSNTAIHIYITSDEEIKKGDWYLTFTNNKVIGYLRKCEDTNWDFSYCKKIILTTDQDLIADGVQAIDDEFLEWFVKNSSCEEVEVELQYQYHSSKEFYRDANYVNCTKEQYESIKKEIPTCPLRILYKIIIPKEEPKQETVEEAAEKLILEYELENTGKIDSEDAKEMLIKFAKWQAERMYSEEDMINFAEFVATYTDKNRNVHGQMLHAKSKYDGSERTTDLLKIWFEQFKKIQQI